MRRKSKQAEVLAKTQLSPSSTYPGISGYMSLNYIARYIWLCSNIHLALQPDISCYIASYMWLYSKKFLGIQSAKKNENLVAYIALPLVAMQLSYIARYTWPYSQIFLATQLLDIKPHRSGYIAESCIASKQLACNFCDGYILHEQSPTI